MLNQNLNLQKVKFPKIKYILVGDQKIKNKKY